MLGAILIRLNFLADTASAVTFGSLGQEEHVLIISTNGKILYIIKNYDSVINSIDR